MSEPGHEFDEPQLASLYQPPDREEQAQEQAEQTEPQLTLREHMLKLLSPSPVPFDELIRVMDAPIAAATALLFELELEGHIHRHPGNLVSINPDRAKQL
jgi:DNA processing protein